MTTWTVTGGGDTRWEIRQDGALTETAASHYDTWEILAIAEQLAMRADNTLAGTPMSWRLTPDGGFAGTTTGHLIEVAERAVLAAYDAGKAAADPDTTRDEHHAALTRYTATSEALYQTLHVIDGRQP